MAAPALLLLWVLAAAAAPPEVAIDAESLLRHGDRGLTEASGHATLTSRGLWVDAERLLYDERLEALTAVGQVVVRIDQGARVVFLADVISLKLEGGEVREVYALEGRGTLRKDVDAATLAAAHTPEAAERAGGVQALLLGNRFLHDGPRWTAEQVSLTPCDCDAAHPSWAIEASSATVDADAERVAVTSPVVRVKGVPVLWLPWLSFPLTDRQTGLLFPRPGFGSLNGFSLDQPVFVTLGRSADLTLSPGFLTGGSGDFGLAGPRLLGELRYTPSRRQSGRLLLGLGYDFRDARDPLNPSRALPTGVPGGLRGELAWAHLQDLDGGFGVRLDLNLHSDGYYFRDVTTDVIASTLGFLRSTAVAFHRTPDALVSLEAVLRQDLGSGYDLLGGARVRSTAPQFGPGTLQRLPALSLALPLRALDGPLSGALTAEYARLAPLYALTGDEGQGAAEGSTLEAGRELSWACQANRLFGAGNAGCLGADHLPVPVDRGGEGDRRWQPGEREARDRFMVVPRLQLSGAAFDVVALSASAWWRQLAWVGEASGRTWSRGALVLDFSAETEASRRFGAWRHTLSPLVQLRAVPAVASGSSDPATPGPVPYDEVDAAVPPGAAGLVQGQVALRQRLSRVGSGDALRLDLAQGFWLPGGGQALSAGELSGRLAATVWLVSASAAARVDPVQGRLTRLQAAAGLDDGRGHGGGVAYENLLDSGTDRTRAPLDLLFGTPVPAWATSRASLLAANAFWSFGAVSVRYDLLFLQAGWAGGRLGLAQHALTVGLSPSCDCWRLDLSAVQRTDANGWLRVPDFGATLTVSRFGSLGTR